MIHQAIVAKYALQVKHVEIHVFPNQKTAMLVLVVHVMHSTIIFSLLMRSMDVCT